MSTLDQYVKSFGDVNAKRSHKLLHRTTKHSYFHGYLHMCGSPIEVLPGDTFKAKLSAFTRMSTPIVPFMDDIRQEFDAYFVPYRILNNKIKNFYGEAEDFGIARSVELPYIVATNKSQDSYFKPLKRTAFKALTNLQKSESFISMLDWIYEPSEPEAGNTKLQLLPLYGFMAIYNEYYRDENYQSSYMWDKDAEGLQDGDKVAYLNSTNINALSLAPQVCKDRDLVTTILPWQVKGTPVTIGLTGAAPIELVNNSDVLADDVKVFTQKSLAGEAVGIQLDKTVDDVTSTIGGFVVFKDPEENKSVYSVSADATGLKSGSLVANLVNTTAVSISNLVYSLAYQNLMARQAKYGTRYKEYIKSMFNTTIPDATEDIPEYLGRMKFRINVNTVVQTTGFNASSSTELGSLGAYSSSGDSKELFNKSFTEPGLVYLVTYTKHKRTYSAGVDRVYLKTEFLDFYQPPLAALYDVPFMRNHIWLSPSDDVAIGWQEPWWDYNSLEDRTYGLMNPMTDTLGEIWTLAEKWNAAPSITGSFLKEDRDAIARVLATGVNGPDYLLDVDLLIDTVRVMPVQSQLALKVM